MLKILLHWVGVNPLPAFLAFCTFYWWQLCQAGITDSCIKGSVWSGYSIGEGQQLGKYPLISQSGVKTSLQAAPQSHSTLWLMKYLTTSVDKKWVLRNWKSPLHFPSKCVFCSLRDGMSLVCCMWLKICPIIYISSVLWGMIGWWEVYLMWAVCDVHTSLMKTGWDSRTWPGHSTNVDSPVSSLMNYCVMVKLGDSEHVTCMWCNSR